MEKTRLNEILNEHKKWLRTNGKEGKRADLHSADLHSADLHSANLRYADLRYADLNQANLRYADLSYADLDYSALPLWCGGLDVNIDDRQATQLLYHLIRNVNYSKNTSKSFKKICRMKSLVKQANKFHRAEECGIIKENTEDESTQNGAK